MDTTLHWSREGKKLPVDENREPIISEQALAAEKLKQQKIKQKEEEAKRKLKIDNENRHRKIEEEHEKLLQEHSIKNMILSSGHKNIYKEEESKESAKKPSKFENPTAISTNLSERPAVLKIRNTDWYDTEIRKAIENKFFDVNQVDLKNFNEIHENFKINEREYYRAITGNESAPNKTENKTDEVRNFISHILENKKD